MTTRLDKTSIASAGTPVLGNQAGPVTGIIHLGLGNFHRAHQAWYTARAVDAEAGDWGILGVANRSRKVVDAMAAQDNLYSVLEISPQGQQVDLVGIHRDTLVGDSDTAHLLTALAAPNHRIVTLTITEAGYCQSPATGGLDTDHPGVAADLAGNALPVTAIGRLAHGLARRAAENGEPITIASCDNMSSNGDATARLVREFAEAAELGDDVLHFLKEKVTFPNSMVDRIVPSTNQTYLDGAASVLGLDDQAVVPAEPFTMWVMEDKFAGGRPAWDKVGVTMSDEVEAYELVKLRLLNGTHSLLAYLGALDGRAIIPESRGQEFIEAAARAVLADEYLPSLTMPSALDADDYIEELFGRWSNTALGHKTSQVGSDGSAKLVQRIPEPALRFLDAGKMPQHLALTTAAWIAATVPPAGFDPGEVAALIVDPAKDRLTELTAGANGAADHAKIIMESGVFPAALVEHDEFTARVGEFTEIIASKGIRAAADEAMATRTQV